MATHISSILQELSVQPGDTGALNKLLNSYPYFETPYILKALSEKDNATTLHHAALVNNNPAWLHALLQPEQSPAAEPKAVDVPAEPVQQDSASEQQEVILVTPKAVEKEAENEPVTSNLQPATSDPGTIEEKQVPVENEPATSNLQPVTSAPGTTPIEGLTFEPFHTVDYFASQGIKPVKDGLPTDRFSHQLRSFTDWLKTMKKLTPVEMEAAALKPAQQEEVEQLAETSLKKTEVLTETMAEVLVKQGRINEAVEILQKLSLLDKGKSAYFAARIQHLKTI